MTDEPADLVTLELRRSPGHNAIAVLTLQNPPLNLISVPLLEALLLALDSPTLAHARAVVLCQGTGRVFSAGSDMNEFSDLVSTGAGSKITVENKVLARLANVSVPVVVSIEGGAFGGGLELALACDIRVASRSAVLCLPEVAVGGLASYATQRLTKLVGPARAKHLLLTGEPISADKAEAWGVVTELADDGRAFRRAVEIAELIARRAPRSIALSKELVDKAADMPLEAGFNASVAAQEEIFRSDDLLEGAAAFAQRRPPIFRGR